MANANASYICFFILDIQRLQAIHSFYILRFFVCVSVCVFSQLIRKLQSGIFRSNSIQRIERDMHCSRTTHETHERNRRTLNLLFGPIN